MLCHSCQCPIPWDGISTIVVCENCRTYRSIDIPDSTGEAIEPLGLPGESLCPGCRCRMSLAAMDGLLVEHCAACSGVLVSGETFAMFVRNRRAEFREAALQPVTILLDSQNRKVRCPCCRGRMNKNPSYGPDFMIIDTCTECSVVWIDCSEVATASCSSV
jgi:Zn-finger nucleic acid-binding protein